DPRTTIGTVNAADFFLTLTVSLTFIATIGLSAFSIAAVGLIIGGLLAAPLGAVLAKRIPARTLMFAVSAVLISTSAFSLYRALAA
ncbi:MAG TPA: sulfite exporter TauE/SafE family protein, partial [Luteimonas sp.]|nr:sulfite exporter TauE/SafE family protein [Luteimonas sp.]